MEIKSQTNTFNGGMDLDTDINYMKSNTYRYAENIRIVTNEDGTNGAIQNIDYIKRFDEVSELKGQNILYAIANKFPYDDENLVNCAIIVSNDPSSWRMCDIFVVTDFDKSKLRCKHLLHTMWNIEEDSKISAIYNYETNSVYKLYINDSKSGLKIINLADYNKDEVTEILNPHEFDAMPIVTMRAPEFREFVSGNLQAGCYQYFYKLSNETGVETNFSPASELIYNGIANPDDTSDSGGFEDGADSPNGIRISIPIDNYQFDYISLYRVFWQSATATPVAGLVTKNRIPEGISTITMTDTVMSQLDMIAQEELNDIVPYVFKAQTMKQYKNRIFFANLQASDWDISEDYDTRAYRCNASKSVRLDSGIENGGITANINDILNGTVVIPADHDCINPMNQLDIYPSGANNEYAYNVDGYYGGSGLNIDFEIVYATTYEGRTRTAEMQNSWTFEDVVDGVVTTRSATASVRGLSWSSPFRGSVNMGKEVLMSFADPTVATKLASYQRDELYRFGIIFYDENSTPSPVHWICDIRFPSGDTTQAPAFASDNENCELLARPLGVKFKIKQFPANAVKAEIVRCDRTESDRSVIAQGMLNNTVHFYNQTFTHTEDDNDKYDPEVSMGDLDIRAPFFPTIAPYWQTSTDTEGGNPDWNNFEMQHWIPEEDVKIFASPEVCMNRTQEVIDRDCYICPVYVLQSYIDATKREQYTDGESGVVTTPGLDECIAAYDRSCDGDDGGINYASRNGRFGRIGGRNISDVTRRVLLTGSTHDDTPTGGVIKYFSHVSADTWMATHSSMSVSGGATKATNPELFRLDINDTKVARYDLPVQDNDDLKAFRGTYVDNIGGYGYTNNAVAGDTFCIAGINQLIAIDNQYGARHLLFNAYQKNNNNASLNDCTPSTVLCNIKRRVSAYGGNTYFARSGSNYISCGGFIEGVGDTVVFGGDTFLSVFNYQHAIMFTKNDWNENPQIYHRFVQVYLPVESTINCYMRNDDYYLKRSNIDNDKQRMYFMNNAGVLNGYTQTKNAYQYNSVYSLSDGAQRYVEGSTNNNISTEELNRYRISCSEVKSPGEEIDSWAKNKFANTIDLDSQFGQVTNLVEFNGKLFAFQENAVNVLAVNDRSLITDENGAQLVLGSGGVLERFDTLIYNYGSGVVNDRSVTTSAYSIYWYDNNKNVICSYGNGFRILSKEKKVQSYLNSIANTNQISMIAIMNDRLNELWMQTKNTTLVYNEQTDCFTSFYTHAPEWGLRFYDKLVTLRGTQFYNIDHMGDQPENLEDRTCKIRFIVNDNPQYTKVFDNQWFSGEVHEVKLDQHKVLNNIQFTTKNQTSFSITGDNVECREDTYRFPVPREDRSYMSVEDEDIKDDMNMSYQPRMRGKYLEANYTIDCNEQRSFNIPFIKTTYRISMM